MGDDGTKYAYETQVFYDSQAGGDIRVMVGVWAVDGSAWSKKLADAVLLKSPDGSTHEWPG